MACSEGVSEEEYCDEHPETHGCPEEEADKDGKGQEDHDKKDESEEDSKGDKKDHGKGEDEAEKDGKGQKEDHDEKDESEEDSKGEKKDHDKGAACCKALTAECMACSEGVSEKEYCAKHKKTRGCSEGGPVTRLRLFDDSAEASKLTRASPANSLSVFAAGCAGILLVVGAAVASRSRRPVESGLPVLLPDEAPDDLFQE